MGKTRTSPKVPNGEDGENGESPCLLAFAGANNECRHLPLLWRDIPAGRIVEDAVPALLEEIKPQDRQQQPDHHASNPARNAGPADQALPPGQARRQPGQHSGHRVAFGYSKQNRR